MKARKKVRMVSIPKSEAEEKIKAAGYECSVIDGVLTLPGNTAPERSGRSPAFWNGSGTAPAGQFGKQEDKE